MNYHPINRISLIQVIPLIFLLPIYAIAGNYSDAVERGKRCEQHGNLGIEIFKTNKIFGKTIKQHAQDARDGKLTQKLLEDFVMISTVSSKGSVPTAKDAYMAAWAECMDSQ